MSTAFLSVAPTSTAQRRAPACSSAVARPATLGASRRSARCGAASSSVFGYESTCNMRSFEPARPAARAPPSWAARADASPGLAVDNAMEAVRKERKLKLLLAVSASNRGQLTTPEERAQIEALIGSLEEATPHPAPLTTGLGDLNGSWRLLWSTAGEIRRLLSLPLTLGSVYQNVNVSSGSFENVAYLSAGPLARGFVRVKATFSAETDRIIRVKFTERQYIAESFLGLPAPAGSDGGEFMLGSQANPGGGTLEVTYLDADMRIGRGGEGSLFVLTKAGAQQPPEP
eukprot:tig00021719_g23158.t1